MIRDQSLIPSDFFSFFNLIYFILDEVEGFNHNCGCGPVEWTQSKWLYQSEVEVNADLPIS